MFKARKNILLVAGVLILAGLITGYSSLEARHFDTSSGDQAGEPADPRKGETFIYGEILSIDGLELDIEQHMDSGSVDVGGSVTLREDVEVYANRGDSELPADLSDLKAGHVVGMVMDADGYIRIITFDDFETAGQEFFVYGEILEIDGRTIRIEQHFQDSNAVDVDGQVTLRRNVTVYANRGDGQVSASLSDLQVGHVVGMNVGTDGLVYSIIFDDYGTAGPADPTRGEIFVYFEIVGLDLEERLIYIEQHMDSGSVEVDSQLRLAGDVKVFIATLDGEVAASLEDLEVGQTGGLILYGERNLKGLVRKVIVDADEQIEPSDPRLGEIFIYAEILEAAGNKLHIDQHMDSGSVDVGGTVTLAANVIIRRLVDGEPVIPMEASELRAGQIVGMIQNADGLIRAIVVE